jgi:hypothetical protein
VGNPLKLDEDTDLFLEVQACEFPAASFLGAKEPL